MDLSEVEISELLWCIIFFVLFLKVVLLLLLPEYLLVA